MPNLDTRTTKTPAVDDYTYLLSNDGTVEGKVELQDVTVIPETTRTINFTSSQTATQIQAEIDSVGKYIPEGATITFQFGNGTYSLDNQLTFKGFYGGGAMFIYGNTSETNNVDLHTTQDVILDFSGENTNGVKLDTCSIPIFVYNLRIEVDDLKTGAYTTKCPYIVRFYYNYIRVLGTGTNSIGLNAVSGSIVEVRETYFSGGNFAIYGSVGTTIFSLINDDISTQPTIGLRTNGSLIYKSSTQPSGSSSNEQTSNGGEIR